MLLSRSAIVSRLESGLVSRVTLTLTLGLIGALGAARPASAADLDGLLSGYSLTSWSDDAGRHRRSTR